MDERTVPDKDLILHNGAIRTFDDRDTEVRAVAIARGRIVATGHSLGQVAAGTGPAGRRRRRSHRAAARRPAWNGSSGTTTF